MKKSQFPFKSLLIITVVTFLLYLFWGNTFAYPLIIQLRAKKGSYLPISGGEQFYFDASLSMHRQ